MLMESVHWMDYILLHLDLKPKKKPIFIPNFKKNIYSIIEKIKNVCVDSNDKIA